MTTFIPRWGLECMDLVYIKPFFLHTLGTQHFQKLKFRLDILSDKSSRDLKRCRFSGVLFLYTISSFS